MNLNRVIRAAILKNAAIYYVPLALLIVVKGPAEVGEAHREWHDIPPGDPEQTSRSTFEKQKNSLEELDFPRSSKAVPSGS